MYTSPGERKQPALMASTLKVVAYSEVVNCWGLNKFQDLRSASYGTKTFSCCHIDSLEWRTSHASCRSQDFNLFALVSAIRLVVLHGVSTLRIKCCVSKISVHKNTTKFISLSAIVYSIRIYCLVTISIRMFY